LLPLVIHGELGPEKTDEGIDFINLAKAFDANVVFIHSASAK